MTDGKRVLPFANKPAKKPAAPTGGLKISVKVERSWTTPDAPTRKP